MAAASLPRVAGIPAQARRAAGALRATVLAAALLGAPALARQAQAQRAAAVRASAMVSSSVLDAGMLPDSIAATRAPVRPVVQRLRIAGVGVLDVESGPGQAIRITRVAVDPASRAMVVVQVFSVGS
jgi:hypothetical protein